MGFRMYCDTWEKGFADVSNGDNESPKYFGYTNHIPLSFKYLQYLARKGLIVMAIPDDYPDLWVFEEYDYMCCVGATSDYILDERSFKAFIEMFIEDLIKDKYELRNSYLEFVNELKDLPGNKVIWWC